MESIARHLQAPGIDSTQYRYQPALHTAPIAASPAASATEMAEPAIVGTPGTKFNTFPNSSNPTRAAGQAPWLAGLRSFSSGTASLLFRRLVKTTKGLQGSASGRDGFLRVRDLQLQRSIDSWAHLM